MDKKILFILNPKSGRNDKKSILSLIDQIIDKDRFDYSTRWTEYVGHASELAAEAVERGFYAVVAVGGDGTVNEVARSLIGSDTALGILPCGSGNGLARHIGVPMDLRKAVEFLNDSEVSAVDYGKINDIPFFCTCGMGFDAQISYNFAKGSQRGFVGYIKQTVHEYMTYESEVYEIECDGETLRTQAFLVACGNAAQYGNSFYIAPHASMKDGKLTVTIMESFPVVEAPVVVGQIFKNKIDRNRHVKTFGGRRIRIHRGSPGVVHLDGEPVEMGADLLVEIAPVGLKVLGAEGWNGGYEALSLGRQMLELFI